MGKNWVGWLSVFFLEATGPHRTQSPGPRPASMPSGISVHTAVGHNGHWPKIGACVPLREGSCVPV